MIALNAHYDGKVIVPDEPLNLPANQKIRIQVEPIDSNDSAKAKPKRILGRQRGQVVYLAPDWDAPLPDHFWEHNNEEQSKP